MAVYKSTHCYPFLNSVDIRVGQYGSPSGEAPAQYLTCKVDTSNTKVTGYRIRLLDENNNQVFPKGDSSIDGVLQFSGLISPISELEIGEDGENSGINGTFLKIPFFQNYHIRKETFGGDTYSSLNAIYYKTEYEVDYYLTGSEFSNNWVADGTSFRYTASLSDPVTIDGEPLMEEQIVFIYNSGNPSVAGIFKAVRISQNNEIIVKLVPINGMSPLSNGEWVAILRGAQNHGAVIESDTGLNVAGENLWAEYTISDDEAEESSFSLPFSGALYKWEITLFQGEGSVYEASDGDGKKYKYITYKSLDNEAFDITQTSGTILGTNSQRIQIANQDPFLLGGEGQSPVWITNPNAVIPNWKEGTVLLQTRYMDLHTITTDIDTEGIFSDTRVYVQTYDATYGHVYPISGSLDTLKVKSATHVQFFKHSNDPTQILDTDMVELGTNSNLPFKWLVLTLDDQSSGDEYIMTEDPDENTWLTESILQRVIGFDPSDLGGIGALIKDGDRILLTGQTYNKKCNGVYTIYTVSAHAGSHSGAKTTYWLLKRAASYNAWGNYLGKIIFCESFSLDNNIKGMNIESLASAGGSLWNPLSSGSGDSPLLFTPELPILLFENLVKYSFDLISETTIDISNPPSLIDNEVPKIGNYVLDLTNGYVYLIEGSNNWSEISSSYGTPNQGEIFYATKGQKYGKRTWRKTNQLSNAVAAWAPFTATILKNTVDYTFISPFLSISEDMRLKIMSSNQALLETDIKTSWLKLSNINNKLFCLKHEKLKEPLSAEVSVDDGTPWKYEIKSNYKTSDINPFYLYEYPYLYLYKDGILYSDLGVEPALREFWSKIEDQWQPFGIQPNPGQDFFLIQGYRDSDAISGDKIRIGGKYVGYFGLEWESYRFVLYNSEGKALQDTGNKYDKLIETTFYGMTEEREYYIVLNVKDNYQNSLFYIIKIETESENPCSVDYNFTATFDCDMGAIRIEAQNLRNILSFDVLRREYGVYKNLKGDFYEFKGEWQPVVIDGEPISKRGGQKILDLWDYNIQSERSYQYALFPTYTGAQQGDLGREKRMLSNSSNNYMVWNEEEEKLEEGGLATSAERGAPIRSFFNYWSIAELIPEDGDIQVPFKKYRYSINSNQIWFFKYGLETGSQAQNIVRNEFQTLGKYPKIGYGKQDYDSGEVSALIGSELIPYTAGYIERLKKSRVSPLSTNEKEKMVDQWKKFVGSKNPKILRNVRGQSWIVQITGGSFSSQDFYTKQPGKISFQWKQIGDTYNTSIVMLNSEDIDKQRSANGEIWVDVFNEEKIN